MRRYSSGKVDRTGSPDFSEPEDKDDHSDSNLSGGEYKLRSSKRKRKVNNSNDSHLFESEDVLVDSWNENSEGVISFNKESYSAKKLLRRSARHNHESPNRRITANMGELEAIMVELQEEENRRPNKNSVPNSPANISVESAKSVRSRSKLISVPTRKSPRHSRTSTDTSINGFDVDKRRQTADAEELQRLIEDMQNDNSREFDVDGKTGRIESLPHEIKKDNEPQFLNDDNEEKSVIRYQVSLRSGRSSSKAKMGRRATADHSDMAQLINDLETDASAMSATTPTTDGILSRDRRETACPADLAKLIGELNTDDSALSSLTPNNDSTTESVSRSPSGYLNSQVALPDNRHHDKDAEDGNETADSMEFAQLISDLREDGPLSEMDDSGENLKHNQHRHYDNRRETADPTDMAQLVGDLLNDSGLEDSKNVSVSIHTDTHTSVNRRDTADPSALAELMDGLHDQSKEDEESHEKEDKKQDLIEESCLSDEGDNNTVCMNDSVLADSSVDSGRGGDRDSNASVLTVGTVDLLRSVENALEGDDNGCDNNESIMSLDGLLHSQQSLTDEQTPDYRTSDIERSESSKSNGRSKSKKSSAKKLGKLRKGSNALAKEGQSPPKDFATSVSQQSVNSIALKSCLSTKKTGLKNAMSSKGKKSGFAEKEKSVVFGSPEVAEFNRLSPVTNYTPMSKVKARSLYSMAEKPQEVEDGDKSEDPITTENNRILEEWDRLANVSESNSPEAEEHSVLSQESEQRDDSDVGEGNTERSKKLRRKKRRSSRLHTSPIANQISGDTDNSLINTSLDNNTVPLPSSLQELLLQEEKQLKIKAGSIELNDSHFSSPHASSSLAVSASVSNVEYADEDVTQEVEADLGILLRRLEDDEVPRERHELSDKDLDDEGENSRLGPLLGNWDRQPDNDVDDQLNNSTIGELLKADPKAEKNWGFVNVNESDKADSEVGSPMLDLSSFMVSREPITTAYHNNMVFDGEMTADLEDSLNDVLVAAEADFVQQEAAAPAASPSAATASNVAADSTATLPDEITIAAHNESLQMIMPAPTPVQVTSPERSDGIVLPETESGINYEAEDSQQTHILQPPGVTLFLADELTQDVDVEIASDIQGGSTSISCESERISSITNIGEKVSSHSVAAIPPVQSPSPSTNSLLKRLRALKEVETDHPYPKRQCPSPLNSKAVGIADVTSDVDHSPADKSRNIVANSKLNFDESIESTLQPSLEKDPLWQSLLSFLVILRKFLHLADSEGSQARLLVVSSLKVAGLSAAASITASLYFTLPAELAEHLEWLCEQLSRPNGDCAVTEEVVLRRFAQEKSALLCLQSGQWEQRWVQEVEQFVELWLAESALAINRRMLALREQQASEREANLNLPATADSGNQAETNIQPSFQVGDKFYNKVVHNTPVATKINSLANGHDNSTFDGQFTHGKTDAAHIWGALKQAEQEAHDLQRMIGITNSLTYCEVTCYQPQCVRISAFLTPRVVAAICFNIVRIGDESNRDQYIVQDTEVEICIGGSTGVSVPEREEQRMDDDFAQLFFASVLCAEDIGGPLSQKSLLASGTPAIIPLVIRKVNGSILSLRIALSKLHQLNAKKGAIARYSFERRGADCSYLLSWSEEDVLRMSLRRFVAPKSSTTSIELDFDNLY